MAEVTNVGVNIAEKSMVIWNVADMLRGPFKPHEYGLVILPMTVIKRFNDCLMPTHNEQREIAIYLDQKCAEIDTLIEKKTSLLAELETYKKSLIYEYVTGKKEVV